MLAARLKKRYRHLRKRMAAAGIEAFRLYERDIPEAPCIVDWYGGEVVAWIFDRTRDETPAQAAAWQASVPAAIEAGLGVPRARIHVKRRARQKGLGQYQRLGQEAVIRRVREGELRFEVNLSDYLDTGLFLDHRTTRFRVGREAKDRQVLNLFAYTGSFSCHAAHGGAAAVLTLDLSTTYTDWARRNLRLNGFDDEDRYQVARVDVLDWLKRPRPPAFDLIVCDPPTFSNSKRMGTKSFSVKRDHAGLIERCLALLRQGGILYFSTNDRGFELDAAIAGGVEITPDSLPEDFRNRKIHRCWRWGDGP